MLGTRSTTVRLPYERRTAAPKALAPPWGDSAQREGGNMRHPVSTSCELKALGGAVLRRVVRFAIEPCTPDHAHPSAREDAHGVRMITAAATSFRVDVRGPGTGVTGVVGQAGERGAQAMVAGPAEGDSSAFAGLIGQRSDAGFSGQMLVAGEALSIAAQFGQDLRGADTACAREAHQDAAIVERGDGVLDAVGQPADVLDDSDERVRQCACQLTLGLCFECA